MNPVVSGARRFSAATAREALRKAREALGPDALVLASRKTGAGVELLAVPPQALDQLARPADTEVVCELRQLSARIAEQLGRLAWVEGTRGRPLRAELARELLNAGFSGALARGATEHLPDDYGAEQARRWLAAALARNLRCTPAEHDVVTRGGAYALVGPTGVGKTTTLAKLAARCVVRHGTASLGLVTTDSYRIGAFDQLRIYGRILGVPVHAAHDEAELDHALAALAGKHLVLIDTVGMGQRDARMREHLELLARPQVKRVLVLSTASQAEAIEDAMFAYRGAGLEGIALTKLDEAVKLGGALDAAIRHRLTLIAVANGQRVPEDLHLANAAYLVDRALRAAAVAGSHRDADTARA
jgi:flagellar biosynthesis protein FlhF